MSLEVDGLTLTRADGMPLLGPITLGLAPGERLGLVGESGSGKSLLVRALFGTLPAGVRQSAGSARAFGIPMDRASRARDHVRGARLAWVPQEPAQALNPLLTLGEHLTLLPGIHQGESHQQALARQAPLLDRLGLPTGKTFLNRFPHQVSGGQRQRLCLAMALSCSPSLLILDEPTTALDPRTQRAFLSLVLELQREQDLGFIWITHDLALAGEACDRLLVLYGGALLEAGPTSRLLTKPRHPYSARLLAAAKRQPNQESGHLSAPEHRPQGCPFRPRCTKAQTACTGWKPWQGNLGNGFRCNHPICYLD